MSTGLVCLRCRSYLGLCSCPRPLPSADAKTALAGTEWGVSREEAARLAEEERKKSEPPSGTRAERRRQERER